MMELDNTYHQAMYYALCLDTRLATLTVAEKQRLVEHELFGLTQIKAPLKRAITHRVIGSNQVGLRRYAYSL